VALFRRKTIRAKTVIASSARTGFAVVQANRQRQRTAQRSPVSMIILIDAVGRAKRSTEWFAATVQLKKPDDNI
jgi:hypothetical protein